MSEIVLADFFGGVWVYSFEHKDTRCHWRGDKQSKARPKTNDCDIEYFAQSSRGSISDENGIVQACYAHSMGWWK